MKYSIFFKSKTRPATGRERTLRQAKGYLFQMALVFFTLIVLAACEQNNALQEDKQPTFTKRAKLYYVPTFALPFPPFLCCHIIETEDNEFFVADHALETFDEDNYDKFTYKKGIHAPVLDVIITYQIITKKKPPCSDDYFPLVFLSLLIILHVAFVILRNILT